MDRIPPRHNVVECLQEGSISAIFRSQENPLSNPYIIEMLLSFLPVLELQKCRFINSTWNTEVQRFLDKAKNVDMEGNNFAPVEQLLREKAAGKTVYVWEVKMKDSNCSNQVFDRFMFRLGTNIHKMTLSYCDIPVYHFQSILSADLLPNLYQLTLVRSNYVDHLSRQTIFIPDPENPAPLKNLRCLDITEVGPSQTTLKNIAAMCPNLKRLVYNNCPCPIVADYRDPSLALRSLEHLQLAPVEGSIMTFHYFEALTALKMERLRIIFLYSMTPGNEKRMKSLKKFLESVSPTLDSLHLCQRILYVPEYKKGSTSPFPVSLPVLTKLAIGPGFVNSMAFLNRLPRLSSFTCVRTEPADWARLVRWGKLKSYSTIRCVDLGQIRHAPLKKLGPCFPNLVKLELNLSLQDNHDEVFRVVFEHFPKLQIFNFFDLTSMHKLTDSGITGIPFGKNGKLSVNRKNPESSRKFPYIGDLKALIDLRLQYVSRQLTDASVEFGIQHIPCLNGLDLSKSQITDYSLDIISRTLLQLTILNIRDCPNITPEGINRFRAMRANVRLCS